LAQQCGVTAILAKPSEYTAILAKVDAALTSGDRLSRPWQDPSQFNRDHLRVVSSALLAKVKDLEGGEQRMAAIVGFAQQIAAERDAHRLVP
jgi:hypothetical protein